MYEVNQKEVAKVCANKNIMRKWKTGHTFILSVLGGLMKHYGKNYCYPSQKKILFLLGEYQQWSRSRSTLNRYLKQLEEWNCISRIKRHTKGVNGEMQFKTTAYYILQQVVEPVKKFFRTARRVADVLRVSTMAQYSLTTKRDLSKSFGNEVEKVPLEWIKDFRLQLQSA